MREEWRDIKGWEGYYQVSNLGNIKSLERKVWCGRGRGYCKIVPEKILKAWKNNCGYLWVVLCKEGSRKNYYVHQLVGNAFLSNPQGYKELNHKDENKENNCANNLEWCSKSYNNNYGTRNKRVAGKLRGRKLSEEHIRKIAEKKSIPIYGINRVSGLIVEFSSAKEAEKTLGINKSHITSCCKGKRKSAGGYYWMYSE